MSTNPYCFPRRCQTPRRPCFAASDSDARVVSQFDSGPPRTFRLNRLLLKWLAVVVVVTGSCAGRAQDVPVIPPQVVDQPKLLAETNLRITHGVVEGKSEITIGLGMLKLNPEVRVEWNPRESLKDAKLTCKVTGHTLTLGADDSSDVRLVHKSDPITKDNDAVVELKVHNPASIPPGIYSGEATFLFRGTSPAFLAEIPARWPITIVVPGRILTKDGLKFTEASNGRLHVGQPAMVTVTMDTIGCDVGEGLLKLRYTPLGGQPRPLLTMPIPIDGILDPIVDVKDPAYVCPEWRNSVIQVGMKENTEPGEHRRYEMVCHVGDCFAPGEQIEAEVTWPQAKEAPDVAEKEFSQTCSAVVGGGIMVSPRLAFDTETVHIQIVSQNDLGPTCDLTLISPDELPGIITLDRDLDSTEAGGANNAGGAKEIVFKYYTSIKPEQLGRWRVTWPDAGRELAGDAAQPTEFNVWGKLVSHLEEYLPAGEARMPLSLRVFASETPLFWSQIYGEDEGRGYYQFRLRAFEIGVPQKYAHDVQFRPLSLYCGIPELPDELSKHDWEKHPYVLITPDSVLPSSTTDEPNAEPAGSFGRPEARQGDDTETSSDDQEVSSPVALPEEGLQAFNVYCSVAPVVGEHSRKAVRDHDFVYRVLISGTDGAGQPIARIVEFPFRVEVTDHWVYYKAWMVWIILGFAAFAVLVLLWWLGNREPRARGLAGSGGGQSMVDEMPELFGGGSTSASAASRTPVADNPIGSESRSSNERPASDGPPADSVAPPRSPPPEIDRDLMDGFV